MNTINMSKNPCITQNRPDIHIHEISPGPAQLSIYNNIDIDFNIGKAISIYWY